jgi:beta-glucosidase
MDNSAKVEEILKQLTLEEKVSLVHGASAMATSPVSRLGIPEFRFSDGPNGVRDEEKVPTTYWPTGVAMAATWNTDLIHQVGVALGEECKGLGKSVLLAPAVNIDRTPLGGRTFEYYSEDPFLAKGIAVDYIKGLQSQNVGACVKHYAVNSIEKERTTVDAQVDERTLREIYLPAFEGAVKEANVASVMAAYNKVNGHYAAENAHLMKDILKGEWKFQGFVMSDWGAVHSTIPTALNGLDLEMPGDPKNFLGAPLLEAIKDGHVPESEIDDKVRRILNTMLGRELPNFDGDPHVSTPAHQELARKVAEESMVLLKNDRSTLPLDINKLKAIAVIGPNANVKLGEGGGSGAVHSPYEVTPLEGLKSYLGDKVTIHYAPGLDTRDLKGDIIPAGVLQTADGKPGLTAEYFDNVDFKGEPVVKRTDSKVDFKWDGSPAPGVKGEYFSVRWTGFLVPAFTGEYEISTSSDDGSDVYIGTKKLVDNWGDHGPQSATARISLEQGRRYPITVRYYQGWGGAEMHLAWAKTTSKNPFIADAVAAAKNSDVVLLFVGLTHRQDSEGADKPDMSLPDGQEELIDAVLKANPHTIPVLINGTPVELAWLSRVHAALEAWYPGQEGGNAIARVLFGEVNPSGRLPMTFPKKLEDSPAHANGDYPPKNGTIRYDEGLLVGYRWYDTKHIAPQFPFGHGLSYSSFTYSNLRATPEGADVDITNVSQRAGAEVVQLYVTEKEPTVMRPEKELKGFKKVFLQAGEKQTVHIPLDRRSFAYYSVAKGDWVVNGGVYVIRVGSSSRDIGRMVNVTVPAS